MRRISGQIGLLLAVHVALLLLASTQFTIATTWLGGRPFTWNYATYHRENGWGYEYVSAYAIPVVIAYMSAYLTGAVAYLMLWRTGARLLAAAGAGLCIVGLLSFSIEASHWLLSHNLSWIASSPLVMLVLAAVAAYRAWKSPTAHVA